MDDLFEIAVKMEENGEAVYKTAIDQLNDPELKKIMEWMAAEEASHAKWFSTLKGKLQISVDEANLKKMVPQVLQDMIGEKTLSLEQIDFSQFKTTNELLKTFIGFEEDTIIFYELLEMFIQEDPTTLSGLKQIIQEEKNHIETLQGRMSNPAEKLHNPM